MKVLYLTSGKSGAGHIHHSLGLKDAMERQAAAGAVPPLDQSVRELFPEKKTPLSVFPRIYGPLVRAAPWVWWLLYHATNSRRIYSLISGMSTPRLKRLALDIMLEEDPDLVVSVYPHINEAVHLARLDLEARRSRKVPMLTAVTTAYSTHASWLMGKPDGLLVCSDNARRDCLKLGIPAGMLRVTGMPLETKFTAVCSENLRSDGSIRKNLRKKMGIKDGTFAALFSGGGPGAGMGRIVRRAAGHPFGWPFHLIVVAGRNDELRDRAAGFPLADGNTLAAHGYVDNMHELMLASDIVIGKSGSMTVQEAVALRRPQIITSYLPGQEKADAEFVESSGAGRLCFSPKKVVKVIGEFRDRHAEMTAKIGALVSASPELSDPDRLTAEAIMGFLGGGSPS